MKAALFVALAIVTIVFVWVWVGSIRRHERLEGTTWLDTVVGFVTNFFDTLGIGSFATTTSMFKGFGLVRDEQIPGTLNVGHTLPTVCEALIYVAIVQVDVVTLSSMIAASCAGAWLGAGVVSRWSRRKVQIGMGLALLGAVGFMLVKQLNMVPGGGEENGVLGVKLATAVAGNFVLGALMTLGIGLFAPCMILVYLLGMNARAAFPIMMGSCAFLMPVGSARFIRERSYNLRAAIGLTLGGIPGVLLAAYLVKELPLKWVTWLVIVVVVYTAVMMLRSAAAERASS